MKHGQFVLALLPLILLASSCGRFGKTYIPRASESSYSRSAVSVLAEESTDYACPGAANVKPDYDYEHDGSGFYTVCANRTDTSKILIHGQTSESDRVCIFPAQIVDSRHIYWKPELSTGLPWVECVEATEQGVFAQFAGISYNAVYLVEELNRDQMQLCLGNANYYGCPAYSFGRFR